MPGVIIPELSYDTLSGVQNGGYGDGCIYGGIARTKCVVLGTVRRILSIA